MNKSKSLLLLETGDTVRRAYVPPAGLRWTRGRFRLSRIAVYAIVISPVLILACSGLTQAAPQREARNPIHLTKAGKKRVARTSGFEVRGS